MTPVINHVNDSCTQWHKKTIKNISQTYSIHTYIARNALSCTALFWFRPISCWLSLHRTPCFLKQYWYHTRIIPYRTNTLFHWQNKYEYIPSINSNCVTASCYYILVDCQIELGVFRKCLKYVYQLTGANTCSSVKSHWHLILSSTRNKCHLVCVDWLSSGITYNALTLELRGVPNWVHSIIVQRTASFLGNYRLHKIEKLWIKYKMPFSSNLCLACCCCLFVFV